MEELRKQINLLQDDIDASRARLAKKNDQVTKISSAVDLADTQLKNLNTSIEKYIKEAQDLKEKSNEIRRSDTKGAYDLVIESAEKSRNSQHKFNQAVDRLNAAETERNRAEQLLREHDKDFKVHYDENTAALQEVERDIAKLEESIPNLNSQVCGGETAQCDAMCGGPSAECGHCGGESCGGSVSKAKLAYDFALEGESKVREKQKEAEEVGLNLLVFLTF